MIIIMILNIIINIYKDNVINKQVVTTGSDRSDSATTADQYAAEVMTKQ